ncbi:putative ribosomal L1 domain-containing protein 1 [Apostichopus japonicus]|uniref:Ribosomal L1 domain-containing protein 1 n=1 Tax=Stichopus japonicus TaxID=307972 RepID=A0A2G8K9F1_STIJA|nr:putative ribosomal L1 domain-containing protein 1 [Apostichopus japonicus]
MATKFNIHQTIEALLAFTKQAKKQKSGEAKEILLADENDQFEIQVSVWIVGGTRTKTVPIQLPHNMYQKDRDALLFVKDIEKKRPEFTEQHFKDLLSDKDVEGVSKVMPIRVLKREYRPFEARRNLARSYDLFLTDVKILGCLSDHLGKEFYKRNKYPVAVDLDKKDLNKEISRAISAAYINLSNKGSCSSVHIAHTGMSTQDIGENVEKAINTIGEKIHGGWDNIKTIHLRTNSSVSLPVYTNLIRPDWDLSKTTPHDLKNEDLDNLQLQLKLEATEKVKSLRKKRGLHPSEPLKLKKPKTGILFNAKPMTGLTRKEKKAATKTMTPRQKRAQSKLREEIV